MIAMMMIAGLIDRSMNRMIKIEISTESWRKSFLIRRCEMQVNIMVAGIQVPVSIWRRSFQVTLIRRSWDNLIFIMRISILVIRHTWFIFNRGSVSWTKPLRDVSLSNHFEQCLLVCLIISCHFLSSVILSYCRWVPSIYTLWWNPVGELSLAS